MPKSYAGMGDSMAPSARRRTVRAPPCNAPVFALRGLFQLHPVALCGRLDALPCRAPFCLRNTLHLVEARSRVAYVGSVLQRFLALLRESKLAGGYPITSWLG